MINTWWVMEAPNGQRFCVVKARVVRDRSSRVGVIAAYLHRLKAGLRSGAALAPGLVSDA